MKKFLMLSMMVTSLVMIASHKNKTSSLRQIIKQAEKEKKETDAKASKEQKKQHNINQSAGQSQEIGVVILDFKVIMDELEGKDNKKNN